MALMFIIELTYKVDLEQIDAQLGAHRAYLDRHYAAGRFLMSGPKVPREGGVILSVGESRAEVEALVLEDPFVAGGLAECRIIEFHASRRADGPEA
jgi:uncharacterized protein YciI